MRWFLILFCAIVIAAWHNTADARGRSGCGCAGNCDVSQTVSYEKKVERTRKVEVEKKAWPWSHTPEAPLPPPIVVPAPVPPVITPDEPVVTPCGPVEAADTREANRSGPVRRLLGAAVRGVGKVARGSARVVKAAVGHERRASRRAGRGE